MTAQPGGSAGAHEPSGALPYGLGFLAYIPIPVVGLLVAGIVMVSVYPSQRRRGGIAAQNGRYAANWGLTVIVVLLLLVASVPVLVSIVSSIEGTSQVGAGPGIPFALGYVLLGLGHVIVLILGLVKANKGLVFENRLAIPFLRSPASAPPRDSQADS